jgi:twitching motility protein PilT
VIWLLRSRDVNVRRMAVELVQTVRDPDGELWPKLLGYLRDEDWWVRERVMDALVGMAGEPLVRHLVGFLNDPSEIIRRFGVDALLRLKSPQSLGALVRTASSDPDWWVRERAIEAVGAIGDARAVPHVVDIMLRNPPLQLTCLQALADMKATAAAPRIAALLTSEDSDVQLAALRCLGTIDDPSVSSSLTTMVRHPRVELRTLARELVERWGQASSPDIVVEQPIPFLDQLLIAVAHAEGDDLILAPGRRPLMKRMGGVTAIGAVPLTQDKVQSLIVPNLSGRQLMDLEANREVDFSYRVESENLRFRVNVFQQMGGMAAVFRIIRASLPDIDKLGLPPVVRGLAELPDGLVLVGGPTGSGKSTTLAALIDHINRTSRRHIVTLEDPIEAVHPRRESLVNQREVGTHTGSFTNALRATLRQDPDVILVGEMRDLPTISFAVTAAETGHLVFGTIHTVSAAGTIDRLIGAFPATQQDHVRSLIAGSLRAVLCQFLLPRADAPGRVLALEVMLNSDAIANLIRKAKAFQIPSIIATSREQGMQLMDTELMKLLKEGKIRGDDAYSKALSKKEFETFASETEQAAGGEPGPGSTTPARGPVLRKS